MVSKQALTIPVLDYKLAADLYAVDGAPKKIVLFLVGNGSAKKNYGEIASSVAEHTGSHAIVLDYSGHGESPFEFEDVSLAHNFMDVLQVFDFIRTSYPDTPVCVVGNSIGGFLAANLTKYRNFEQLILRVPALYRPEIFYDKRRDYDRPANHEYRHDPERTATHPIIRRSKQFSGNTFVITHEHDDICPPATTDRFIEAFSADHWRAEGFVHSFGDSKPTNEQREEYLGQMSEWINSN